jgi:hypothetical protein
MDFSGMCPNNPASLVSSFCYCRFQDMELLTWYDSGWGVQDNSCQHLTLLTLEDDGKFQEGVET